MKTLGQKVEELNEFCDGSLGFTYFPRGWEVSSYERSSLFHTEGEIYKENDGYLRDKTFAGIVNRAYKAMSKVKDQK